MRKKIKALVVVGILVLAMGIAGFPHPLLASEEGEEPSQVEEKLKPSEDITIGLSMWSAFNITEQDIMAGAKKKANELGVNLKISVAAGDSVRQVADIENLIEEKVDALCLASYTPEITAPVVERAWANGIPTFSIESRLTGEGVMSEFTSNNMQVGMTMAEWMERKATGFQGEQWKGSKVFKEHKPLNLIMFTLPQFEVTTIRYEGAMRIFKTNPNVHIIETHAISKADVGMEEGRRMMEAFLLKYPNSGDITMVWAAYDHPVMGAAEAIMAAGREKEIFCMGCDGGDLMTFNYIIKHTPACATMGQKPFEMGAQAVDSAVKYLKGERVERWTFLPADLVHEGNVHPYAYKRWPKEYVEKVKSGEITLPSDAFVWLSPEDAEELFK